ncbi:hypothetical protein SOVF_019370 [Spinacia oleracea]|nr:hypothetical protein SOVF_019370 [Spinacia oleracea]
MKLNGGILISSSLLRLFKNPNKFEEEEEEFPNFNCDNCLCNNLGRLCKGTQEITRKSP